MTKKENENLAFLMEAIRCCFRENENSKQTQERTPVHTIAPGMFAAMCKNAGVSEETTYMMAAFALALVNGMAKEPGNVAAMCGGADGGSLIVALEALRVSMSNNNKNE